MTPERHERIKRVFLEAQALAPVNRPAFLDRACAEDRLLRAEVESLLENGAADTGMFHAAAEGAAADWAGGEGGVAHPERIGSYRITGVLGAGGMGVVYRAEQMRPRRTVALKVLREGVVSPQATRRFEHEAQVLGRLHHPGIAQVYEAGSAETGSGRRLFFAMELVEGRTLTEYARDKSLTVRERVALFARVCEAVEHAHRMGVIHRDLKPGNILVDTTGQPKVLDFGVARTTGSDVRVTTLNTDVGQLIGTLAYMSPEQAAGDPDRLDARSDVYALGVVLYELLSGRLPYAVGHRMIPEAVRVIREQDPASLSTVSRVFRGDLETICAKALEKEPARRYQSAAALGADLTRHLLHEAISARPPTTMYQLRKFARRHKALVGGLAAVFVVLVAGVFATTTQAILAIRHLDRAEEAESLATRRLAEVQAILDFVNNRMFASVDPANARGRLVTVREVLDSASRSVETEFKDQPLVEASVRMTLGNVYRRLGQYDAAHPHVERAIELRRRELGDEHAETLDALTIRAALLDNEGRYMDEQAVLVPLIESMERTLGADHPQTLVTRGNLASCLNGQGLHAEAERLMLAVLERQRAVLAPDAEDLEFTLNNLGAIYRDQGRPDRAEPLWREALALRERRAGKDHPDSLVVLNNLAIAAAEQGRLDEAVSLHRRVFESSERIWGPRHPITNMVRGNLGGLLVRMSRYQEAESHLRAARDAHKETGDADHPDSAMIATVLAQVYLHTGQYARAEAELIEALEVFRDAQGADAPQLLNAERGLAVVYRYWGRFERADVLLQELLRRCRNAGGDQHPLVPMLLGDMGLLRRDEGRYAEAEHLLRQSLSDGRQEARPLTAAALAESVWRLGRDAEAETLFAEAVEEGRREFAPGHRFFGLILPPFARFLVARGRFAEAEPLLLEAHGILAGLRGEGDASVRHIAADLADLYDTWAAAEPVAGRKDLAAHWRARLDPVGSRPSTP